MDKITEIALAWDLFGQGVPKARIAQHLGRNRETIILWLQGIQEQGLGAFLEQHQKAKKQPRPARQVRTPTKQLVWAIREHEHGCCGQKIAYFLQKEHQIHLSVPKIYEILAEKYTLRPKGRKNHKRGEVPQAEAARQIIQMDTVHFGQVFAFTAVDIFTREADVLLRPSLLAADGEAFLKFTMPRRFGGGRRPSRLTAAVSSRLSSPPRRVCAAASTGSPAPTRRMSSPSSRASTARFAASAWAGASTAWRSCQR